MRKYPGRMALGLLAALLAGVLQGCAVSPSEETQIPKERHIIDVTAIQEDMPVSIAVDASDRLYVAAGEEIHIYTPWGEPAGIWGGLRHCLHIAYAQGQIYALDQDTEGGERYILRVWDSVEGVEKAAWPLELPGTVSRLYALGDRLLVSCYVDEEEGPGYGQGFLLDPQTGLLEVYAPAGGLYWAVPADKGFYWVGNGTFFTGKLEEPPESVTWMPLSDAGCRMQDDGTIYYCVGRALGVMDAGQQQAVGCGALDSGFVWQMAGGSRMVYVYHAQEGKIVCIPESQLQIPRETLTLLLPEEPQTYLLRCMADYMLQRPGTLVRYEVQDAYAMKTRLLAGAEIDIVGVYAHQVYGTGYAQAGLLEDLHGYPALAAVREDPRLIDGILEGFQQEGAWWTVPVQLTLPALRVHTEAFRQAGLPLPAKEWSWLEFFSMLGQFPGDTDGDGGLEWIPYAVETLGSWPPFLEDYAVSFYRAEERTIAFDTPQFRSLMQAWREALEAPWVSAASKTASENTAMQPVELYVNVTDLWDGHGGEIPVEAYPYRFVPLPSLDGEGMARARTGSGLELGLYSLGENRGLAADFLAFVSGYDQRHAAAFHVDKGILYAVESVEEYSHTDTEDQIWYRAFRQSDQAFLEYAYPVYAWLAPQMRPSLITQELREAMKDCVDRYRLGQITLDELVAELTEKAEMMLR